MSLPKFTSPKFTVGNTVRVIKEFTTSENEEYSEIGWEPEMKGYVGYIGIVTEIHEF